MKAKKIIISAMAATAAMAMSVSASAVSLGGYPLTYYSKKNSETQGMGMSAISANPYTNDLYTYTDSVYTIHFAATGQYADTIITDRTGTSSAPTSATVDGKYYYIKAITSTHDFKVNGLSLNNQKSST